MTTLGGNALRVRSILRPDRVDELTPLQQEQLAIAGKRYDGGDYSAAERLSFEGSDASPGGQEQSFKGFLEFREIVDASGQAAGGMTTKDGSRRRTPGGVFFTLAYERFGPKRARSVRARADRRFEEEMLKKFFKLLALVLPASAERPASTIEAAPAPAPPTPEPAAQAPAAKLAASAPAPTKAPAKPARRQELEAVEVVVVRRRAGATPTAKPGPSTSGG